MTGAVLDGPPTWWDDAPPPASEDDYGAGPPVERSAVSHRSIAAATGNFVFDGEFVVSSPAGLIKDLLPLAGVGFIGGQSGAGKSFIMIDLALALAIGGMFFGRQVRERVGVVILAAEGAGTMENRITAAKLHRGVTELSPIAVMRKVPILSEAASMAWLIEELKQAAIRFRHDHGVRLGVVFIDTLAAAFGFEDENSNAEAARVIRLLNEIAAAIDGLAIAVHHYGKSAETGLRGASALRAGADFVISVPADRDELAATCSNRRIALAKSRSTDEGPISGFELRTIPLGVDEDGYEYGAGVVVPLDLPASSTRRRKQSKAVSTFNAAFDDAMLDHVQAHRVRGDGPSVRAVEIRHVRTEFLRRYATGKEDPAARKNSSRMAFGRALARCGEAYGTETRGNIEWIWRL